MNKNIFSCMVSEICGNELNKGDILAIYTKTIVFNIFSLKNLELKNDFLIVRDGKIINAIPYGKIEYINLVQE